MEKGSGGIKTANHQATANSSDKKNRIINVFMISTEIAKPLDGLYFVEEKISILLLSRLKLE